MKEKNGGKEIASLSNPVQLHSGSRSGSGSNGHSSLSSIPLLSSPPRRASVSSSSNSINREIITPFLPMESKSSSSNISKIIPEGRKHTEFLDSTSAVESSLLEAQKNSIIQNNSNNDEIKKITVKQTPTLLLTAQERKKRFSMLKRKNNLNRRQLLRTAAEKDANMFINNMREPKTAHGDAKTNPVLLKAPDVGENTNERLNFNTSISSSTKPDSKSHQGSEIKFKRRRLHDEKYNSLANDANMKINTLKSPYQIPTHKRENKSTRLHEDYNMSTKKNRKNQKPISLFGAVMNRSYATSPFSPTKHKKDEISTPIHTPDRLNSLKDVSPKNDDLSHQTPPTHLKIHRSPNASLHTPTVRNTNSNSNSNLTFNSPGGFTLLRVLDSINNATPSRHLSPHQSDDKSTNSNGSSRLSSLHSGGTAPLDDWYEADLGIFQRSKYRNSSSTKIGPLLDWSIKNKFKIDCLPGHSLSLLPHSNDLQHVPYGMNPCTSVLPISSHEFRTSPVGKDSNAINSQTNIDPPQSLFTSSHVKKVWQSALSYWRHPSNYFDPDFMKLWNLSTFTKEKEQNNGLGITSLTNVNGHKNRVPKFNENYHNSQHSIFSDRSKINSYVKDIQNNSVYNQEKRWREWQSAFRSMYMRWLSLPEKENEKNQHNEEAGINTEANKSNPFEFNHNMPCFYAIQHIQESLATPKYHLVVLFRFCTLDRKQAKPMIVMSNIPSALAAQLLEMDVTLHNYTHPNTSMNTKHLDTPKSANMMHTLSKPNGVDGGNHGNVTTKAAKDEYQEELEALRYASTHEETVGGEILVQRKHRASISKFSETAHVTDLKDPIIIQGSADCHTFYEIFLNNKPNFEKGDVPLLLSRMLGPTLNTTLSSLTIKRCRKEQNTVTESKGDKDEFNEGSLSSLEVEGLILPCAVRQLINAMTLTLLLDKSYEDNENDNNKSTTEGDLKFNLGSLFKNDEVLSPGNNSVTSDEDVVGSHYFVAHLKTLNGGGNLNGCKLEHIENEDENFEEKCALEECRKGEITSMFVWNITRPKTVMYKTEKSRK